MRFDGIPVNQSARDEGAYVFGLFRGSARQLHSCAKCGADTELLLRPKGSFDTYHGVRRLDGKRRCPVKSHWWDGHSDSGWQEMDYHPPMPRPPDPRDPGL